MKYILLLFLIIPNVLCFVTHISRRHKYKGYFSKARKYDVERIILKGGQNCSEKFSTIYAEVREEWDALTGLKTIREAFCEEDKICDDNTGPAIYKYFCIPDTEDLCLIASEGICTSSRRINIDCRCDYHHPSHFKYNI